MSRFNIPLIAEGLTAYAIERQNGFERRQLEHAPPWSDQRRFWTDAILQGMTRLDGFEPDTQLMERYDQQLDAAHGYFAIEPASLQLQQETIRNLRCFVTALEDTGDDRRQQVNVIRKLLEDMASHLPWAGANNNLDLARGEAESTLLSMTAQMPIRFTRVLLGGERGPCESDFVSGSVTDADAVKATALYERMSQRYPEVTEWPSICTVYVGRGLDSAWGTTDASDFDLGIMREVGDRFLNLPGIRFVGGGELKIPAEELTQGPQMNLTM